MAKRKKKMNVKVWVVLGAVVVGLAVFVVAARSFVKHKRDPAKAIEKARTMYVTCKEEPGNASLWKDTADQFQRAVAYAKEDPMQEAGFRMEFAEFLKTWRLKRAKDLSREMHMQILGNYMNQLESVLRVDPDQKDARDQLTDLFWENARQSGQFDRFIGSASEQIRLEPENAQAYFRLAQAYQSMAVARPQEAEKAEEYYQKAVELAPNEVSYWLAWVNFKAARNRPREANDLFEQAVEKNPDSAWLVASYANFLAAQPEANMERVQNLIQTAEAVETKTVEGHMALAVYALRIRPPEKMAADYDKAIEELQAALTIDPTAAGAYAQMADIYWRQGKPDLAEEVLRGGLEEIEAIRGNKVLEELSAVELDQYLGSRVVLNQQLANIMLGRLPADPQQREQALEQVRQSIAAAKEYAADQPMTLKIEGRLALVQGNVVEAERLLRQAYDRFRQLDLETAELLINVYLQMRQLGEADQIVSRLEAAAPNHVGLMVLRTRLQMDYQQPQAALNTIAKAMQLRPSPEQIRVLEELRIRAQARLGGAIEEAALPESIPAEDVSLWLLRAGAALQEGKIDRATEIYTAILQQHPGNMLALAQMIAVYVEAEQLDRANALIDEAIRKNPDIAEQLEFQKKVVNAPDKQTRDQLIFEDIQRRLDGVVRELELARYYGQRGRTDEQQGHLRKALELDPKTPGVLEQLFQLYLSQRRHDEAAGLLALAREHNLDSFGGEFYRARLDVARGKPDEAIANLRALLANQQQFSLGHAVLGEAYLVKNDLADAERSFQTARSQNPANVVALIGLARVAELQGKTQQHQQYLLEAARFVPNHPYVREKTLQLAAAVDPAQAIAPREQKYQADLAAVNQGGEMDIQNAALLANLYMQTDPPDPQKAEAVYREIYNYAKGKPGALTPLALLTDFLGRTGRAREAQDLIAAALEDEEADKPGIWVLYGSLIAQYSQSEDVRERAARAFQSAIDADPADPRGYDAAARFAEQIGDWPRAIDMTQKLKNVRKDDPMLDYRLIRLQINAGNTRAALAATEAMLARDANDANALRLHGMALERDGQIDKAIEDYTKAIAAAPQSAEPRVARAEAYMYQGRLEQADADLEEAYRISPTLEILEARVNLAMRQDAPQRAAARLRQALDQMPQSVQVRRALVDVYQKVAVQTGDWTGLAAQLVDNQKKFPEDPQWLVAEADMWRQREALGREVAAAAKAVELQPQSPALYLRLADAQVRAKLYDEAIALLQGHLEDAGVGGAVHARLGEALLGKGMEPEGLASFREAFKRAQGSQPMQFAAMLRDAAGAQRGVSLLSQWEAVDGGWALPLALSQEYVRAAQWEDARRAATAAHGRATDQTVRGLAARQLGLICYNANDFADAEKYYAEAVRLLNDPGSVNNLAYLLAVKLNRPKDALPYAQRASAALPNDANVADTLGTVYQLLGDQQEALKHITRSIQLAPSATNLFHRGQVYEALNDMDKANADYRRAWEMVKNRPSDEMYQQVKQRVEAIGN